MKSIIIFCVFLIISLSYGNPSSVLIIRPDTYSYKKFEMTLKKRLGKNVTVQSATPLNQSELRTIFENNSSQLVVVMDKKLISTWTELHNASPQVKVSSIFIGSEFDRPSIVNSIKHNCTIIYRIGLDQYVDNAYKLTGKKPQRIGIIYSYKYLRFVQALKNDCNHLNVSLFPYAVSSSNTESSVKSIITNMTSNNNIDLLIIPDDPLVMNFQNLKAIWDRQLKSLTVPVSIPPAFLSGISRTDNIFSLQQDLSEIVDHTAKLILEVKSNNWRITRREISADKGICLLPKRQLDKADENQSNTTIAIEIKPPEFPENKSTLSSDSANNRNSSLPTVTSSLPGKQMPGLFKPDTENNRILKTVASSSINKSTKAFNGKPSVKSATVIKKTKKQIVHSSNQDQIHKVQYKVQHEVYDISGNNKTVERVHLKRDAIHHTKQPFISIATIAHILSLTVILFLIVYLTAQILIPREKKAHSNSMLKKYLLLTGKHPRIKYSSTNKKLVSITKIIRNYGHQVKVLKNSHSLHDYLQHHSVDLIIIDFNVNHYIRSLGFQTLMERSTNLPLLFYNVSNTAEIKQNFHYVQKLFVFNNNFTISDLNKVLFMININECTSPQSSNVTETYLEGIFHKDTLFEILQMIDTGKKTGCLLVENDDQSGIIFFEDGIITYAMSNMIVAEDAVFAILSQKHGSFRFISDKKPITQQLCLNVQNILLERARIEDETTHTNLELLMQQSTPDNNPTLNNPLTNAFDKCINVS